MNPLVSIVILNWNNPHFIDVCLHSVAITQGITYEVVVVDNGSTDPDSLPNLRRYRDQGLITTLVEHPHNSYFSEGNNIGVRASNPTSEYLLLLNSDVGVLRSDWLVKLVGWAEGTVSYTPAIWGSHPNIPSPGPRDIVSAGFAFDPQVEPARMRPEGFCCLIRRSVWSDISTDFPQCYGLEEMLANAIRSGAKCGVLSQYPPYIVHREGGSAPGTWTCETFTKDDMHIVDARTPDIPGWFAGLDVETLDFSLGPHEHDSYLNW